MITVVKILLLTIKYSMDSKDILYSKWGNDECYTPEYAVIPIGKYISKLPFEERKELTIWCPFDKEESNFVKLLRRGGYNVICSHIDNWQDFYTYKPTEHWDIIISNPPFTNKKQIFERALSFNKPFALLMTLTWLNDSWPKLLFMEKDLQLLMFDKRISYINAWWSPTFSSAYYCRNFLPKQIIMERIIKK